MKEIDDQSPIGPSAAVTNGTSARRTAARRFLVPISIIAGVGLLLGLGAMVVQRSEAKVNKVALTDAPKPVSALAVKASMFRPSRTYVGTIEPWIEAKVGPQLVAAYVDTVLVRPGAVVRRGDVLATLDCRNASATSQAVSMQARALGAQQEASAHEADRVQGLLHGGFVSPNEAEQKSAQSAAQQAELLATQAKLLGTALEVSDCVLRAPFDAEVVTRNVDPGAFVRPGTAIVSIVDRRLLRVTADAPEVDFDVVAPGTAVQVHALATGRDLVGSITRRSPAADESTRTVHFEIDLPDPRKDIPVGTTAELRIQIGEAVSTIEVPLSAAAVRGEKASLFYAEGGIAHARTVRVKGEAAGRLYLEPELPAGTLVITEGRALLQDGDKVSVSIEQTVAPSAPLTAAPATSDSPTKDR